MLTGFSLIKSSAFFCLVTAFIAACGSSAPLPLPLPLPQSNPTPSSVPQNFAPSQIFTHCSVSVEGPDPDKDPDSRDFCGDSDQSLKSRKENLFRLDANTVIRLDSEFNFDSGNALSTFSFVIISVHTDTNAEDIETTLLDAEYPATQDFIAIDSGYQYRVSCETTAKCKPKNVHHHRPRP